MSSRRIIARNEDSSLDALKSVVLITARMTQQRRRVDDVTRLCNV